MVAFEKYRDVQPQPGLGSVPTPEQRSGDFSQTFQSNGKPYIIYDPLTVQLNPAFDPTKSIALSNLQYLRQSVPGNKVPSARFNQVALNVLKDVPLPNQTGDSDYAPEQLVRRRREFGHGLLQRHRPRGSQYQRPDADLRPLGPEFPGRRQEERVQLGHQCRSSTATPAGTMTAAWSTWCDTLNPPDHLSARIGFNRYVYSSIYSYQDLSYLGHPGHQPVADARQVPAVQVEELYRHQRGG